LLYFSRSKKCAVCGELVDWLEAEAHHKTPHIDGGITLLENADLVHKKCHPRGRATLEAEEQEGASSEIPWEIENNDTE